MLLNSEVGRHSHADSCRCLTVGGKGLPPYDYIPSPEGEGS